MSLYLYGIKILKIKMNDGRRCVCIKVRPSKNQPTTVVVMDRPAIICRSSCLFLLHLLVPITGIAPFLLFIHTIFTFARDVTRAVDPDGLVKPFTFPLAFCTTPHTDAGIGDEFPSDIRPRSMRRKGVVEFMSNSMKFG